MNTLKNLILVGYSKEHKLEDVLKALAFHVSRKNEVLPAFIVGAGTGCFWGKFLEHFGEPDITPDAQEEIFEIEHRLFDRMTLHEQRVLVLRNESQEQASVYYSLHINVITGLSRWLRMYNNSKCYAVKISTQQIEGVEAEAEPQFATA